MLLCSYFFSLLLPPPRSTLFPYTTLFRSVVLALIRGDDRLSESKLLSALKIGSHPSTDEEIRSAFGASGGSLGPVRSEEHTSELQSRRDLVCRLLLEKKKK